VDFRVIYELEKFMKLMIYILQHRIIYITYIYSGFYNIITITCISFDIIQHPIIFNYELLHNYIKLNYQKLQFFFIINRKWFYAIGYIILF